MKSTLLLIIGMLPLGLLNIVSLMATFGELSLDPIPPLPTEIQNLQASNSDAKQAAESAYPYLLEVDISIAKKDFISANLETPLNELTTDVLQYVKLRKSLSGIWDLHLKEDAFGRLTTTVLNNLLKRYDSLGYDGLTAENAIIYREYATAEIDRLTELLGTSAEFDREVVQWNKAEGAFKAKEFESAGRLLKVLDMETLLKFTPPIATRERVADLIKACDYNIALKVIELEKSSLENRLQFLTVDDVDDLLMRIRNFEQKYPSPPAETEQKPYTELQMAKKAFSLFKELLVREISNEPTAWPGELQKLVNDITNLREFGDSFSLPILEIQKKKLGDKLAMLAFGQALVVPPELEMFECLYYMPTAKGGRILFAAKIIKNKTGFLLDNVRKPPEWFFVNKKSPVIPFAIRNNEINLAAIQAADQLIVKKFLKDNTPQKSPLLGIYKMHNDRINALEKDSSNIDLWEKLLKYILDTKVDLVDYKSIGGGYLEEVDIKLNSLESVSKKIVAARSEIKRFLQQ
jgi:hypothetical protein